MWHTQFAIHQSRDTSWAAAQKTENGVAAVALVKAKSDTMAQLAAQQLCNRLCGDFSALYDLPMVCRQLLTERPQAMVQPPVNAKQDCAVLAAAVYGDRYLLFHMGCGTAVYQYAGQVESHFGPNDIDDGVIRTWVELGEQPQLEGIVLLPDRIAAPQVEQLLQQSELLRPEISRTIFQEFLTQLSQGGALAVLSRTGRHLGRWERLTQRQKAQILEVRTQNRNRRRHTVRRGWNLWGRGSLTTVLWVSKEPMTPELYQSLEQAVGNRVDLLFPGPWRTVETLRPLVAQTDIVAAQLPLRQMMDLQAICGKKTLIQPQSSGSVAGHSSSWCRLCRLKLELQELIRTSAVSFSEEAFDAITTERSDNNA